MRAVLSPELPQPRRGADVFRERAHVRAMVHAVLDPRVVLDKQMVVRRRHRLLHLAFKQRYPKH